jgi:pentose-5-phosphate-3-epimerase
LIEAGAQALVVGYPIFSSQDYRQAVAALRHGVEEVVA